MKAIENYLNDILYPQLKEVNMPYRFTSAIQDDIRNRMESCLSLWQDEEVRKTILFPSLEEALFYEPVAQTGVREFVVTTIRNSMLEVAASVNCMNLKIQEPLSDAQIKNITSTAIKYFAQFDFIELSKEISCEDNNMYISLIEKYPLAWEALSKLANMKVNEKEISITVDKKFKQEEFNNDKLELKTIVCDGFTLEFDEYLNQVINQIISGKLSCFYTHCFKMLSRNIEKVLHVLQIILENGSAFCTSNCYISCYHIEKRNKIVRAAHNEQDVLKNLNRGSTPPMIKYCMETMLKSKQR